MDEVDVAGVVVDRIVLEAAAVLFLAGAACGGLATWSRTTRQTRWRMPRCLMGACAVGTATLLAGYVGVVVLYVAGSLLPDALVYAAWPLGLAACAGIAWASARVLLPVLAAGRP